MVSLATFSHKESSIYVGKYTIVPWIMWVRHSLGPARFLFGNIYLVISEALFGLIWYHLGCPPSQ